MAGGKHLLGKPRGKHIFGTAKVGEKGQIVIPAEVREMFGIAPGSSLLLLADVAQGIAIPPASEAQKIMETITSYMNPEAKSE